jgi:uncharacterized protein (TIGR02271 family)
MEGKGNPPPPTSQPERSPPEGSSATPSGAVGAEVLQLFAEEAEVARRTVETGRVRVATVTHTRDHLADEWLARTNVEVDRIPIDRVIEAIPPVKEDAGLTIIPIVEETVVVERKLVLKEELHIRRKQTTERFQQTVPLRYQTAQITRIPAPEGAADAEAAAGSITKRNPEDT